MTTKEQLAAAEALFRDIQAEFGAPKKKASKALRGTKPAKTPKEDETQSFLRESNKLALLMESPTWQPVSIANHIVTQNCQQCGHSNEYVGGTLIRHKHKHSGDIWEYPRPYSPSFSALPQIIEEMEVLIPACPDCLRQGHFGRLIKDERVEKQLAAAQGLQAELIAETDDSGEPDGDLCDE